MELIVELLRETGSHLNADIQKWKFAAGYGEVSVAALLTQFVNVHRDPKKHPQLLEGHFPWSGEPVQEEVAPEERVRLRALLVSRSAFAPDQ